MALLRLYLRRGRGGKEGGREGTKREVRGKGGSELRPPSCKKKKRGVVEFGCLRIGGGENAR